jgi:hypothetical protein
VLSTVEPQLGRSKLRQIAKVCKVSGGTHSWFISPPEPSGKFPLLPMLLGLHRIVKPSYKKFDPETGA